MFKSIKIQPCKNNVGAIIDTDIQSADPECINEIKIALDAENDEYLQDNLFQVTTEDPEDAT